MSLASRSALRVSALVAVLGGLAPLALPAHAGAAPAPSYTVVTTGRTTRTA